MSKRYLKIFNIILISFIILGGINTLMLIILDFSYGIPGLTGWETRSGDYSYNIHGKRVTVSKNIYYLLRYTFVFWLITMPIAIISSALYQYINSKKAGYF